MHHLTRTVRDFTAFVMLTEGRPWMPGAA